MTLARLQQQLACCCGYFIPGRPIICFARNSKYVGLYTKKKPGLYTKKKPGDYAIYLCMH